MMCLMKLLKMITAITHYFFYMVKTFWLVGCKVLWVSSIKYSNFFGICSHYSFLHQVPISICLMVLVLTCSIWALKTNALLAHLLITLFLFIWQVICSWSLITRLQKFILFRLLCEVTAYSMLFKNGFRISIAEFLRPQSFQNDKILLVQSKMQ